MHLGNAQFGLLEGQSAGVTGLQCMVLLFIYNYEIQCTFYFFIFFCEDETRVF